MSKYTGMIGNQHTLLSSAVLGHFKRGVWIGGIEPHLCIPGRVAQLVMCLVTDACLTADPGVGTLILAQSRTFVEIYHEIISAVILLPPAYSFKEGCCQLQANVCTRSTAMVNRMFNLKTQL